MNKISNILMTLGVCLSLTACNGDDVEIGDSIDILKEYSLPQQGASAAANQMIVNFYNKYGSYFLYDYTEKDAFWSQASGSANSQSIYHTVHGDLNNVEPMINFLYDNWLKYFPENFLKKGGVPYRVFLADSVYYERDFGGGYIRKYASNYLIGSNSIIIAGMNQIPNMSDAEKKVRKIELINAIWNDFYNANGILGVPQEFYDVTDYVTIPHKTLNGNFYIWGPGDLEAYRARGFVQKATLSAFGTSYSEWFLMNNTFYNNWSSAKTEDLASYMSLIFIANDEKMEEYLQYPLIKQKWDILLNYYKDNYGIDLRKIALE